VIVAPDRKTYQTFYQELGRNVRLARTKSHQTQAQLASAVGLSRVAINNIEFGRQQLLSHTLFAIANALAISVQELLPQSLKLVSQESPSLPVDITKEEKIALERQLQTIGLSPISDKRKNPKGRTR